MACAIGRIDHDWNDTKSCMDQTADSDNHVAVPDLNSIKSLTWSGAYPKPREYNTR